MKSKQTHFELLKMIHHQGFRSGTFPILSPYLPICFYKDSSSYGATFPSFMKHSALSFSIPSIKSVHPPLWRFRSALHFLRDRFLKIYVLGRNKRAWGRHWQSSEVGGNKRKTNTLLVLVFLIGFITHKWAGTKLIFHVRGQSLDSPSC